MLCNNRFSNSINLIQDCTEHLTFFIVLSLISPQMEERKWRRSEELSSQVCLCLCDAGVYAHVSPYTVCVFASLLSSVCTVRNKTHHCGCHNAFSSLIHSEMFSYSVKAFWLGAQVANECITPLHLGELFSKGLFK